VFEDRETLKSIERDRRPIPGKLEVDELDSLEIPQRVESTVLSLFGGTRGRIRLSSNQNAHIDRRAGTCVSINSFGDDGRIPQGASRRARSSC
jgi:hypothetical protein